MDPARGNANVSADINNDASLDSNVETSSAESTIFTDASLLSMGTTNDSGRTSDESFSQDQVQVNQSMIDRVLAWDDSTQTTQDSGVSFKVTKKEIVDGFRGFPAAAEPLQEVVVAGPAQPAAEPIQNVAVVAEPARDAAVVAGPAQSAAVVAGPAQPAAVVAGPAQPAAKPNKEVAKPAQDAAVVAEPPQPPAEPSAATAAAVGAPGPSAEDPGTSRVSDEFPELRQINNLLELFETCPMSELQKDRLYFNLVQGLNADRVKLLEAQQNYERRKQFIKDFEFARKAYERVAMERELIQAETPIEENPAPPVAEPEPEVQPAAAAANKAEEPPEAAPAPEEANAADDFETSNIVNGQRVYNPHLADFEQRPSFPIIIGGVYPDTRLIIPSPRNDYDIDVMIHFRARGVVRPGHLIPDPDDQPVAIHCVLPSLNFMIEPQIPANFLEQHLPNPNQGRNEEQDGNQGQDGNPGQDGNQDQAGNPDPNEAPKQESPEDEQEEK